MDKAMCWHDYETDYSKPDNLLRPMRAVRVKCLDCCCQNRAEVVKCPIETCSLWPYRMGRRPSTLSARDRARTPS